MFSKRYAYALAFAGTLAFAIPTFAQKPAGAPANATAQCSDGTYSTAKTRTGACSRHGGVKAWWGAADANTPTSAKSTPTSPAASSGGAAASAGSAPKDATGQCADGTYTRAKTQTGACSRHGGVKTWFAAETVAKPPAPTSLAASPATAPASRPAPTAAPKPAIATTAAPAGAPAGATAKCKDGTYSMSKTHSGACSHHGGVAEWYK